MRGCAVSRGTRRAGFTLLEITVVMAVLGVAVLVSGAAVVGSLRVERAAAVAFNRRATLAVLADRFRADVAAAVAAPERLDRLTAGPACLLLRAADGRHIVYRWRGGRLERLERVGSALRQRRILIASASGTIEFHRSGKDRSLLALRLIRPRPPGNEKRVLEIVAALGGDNR